jgi:hypothetical protein
MIFFTVFFGVLGFFAACMLIRFWFVVIPATGVAAVVLFLVWLPLAKHANQENMRLYSHPLQESAIGLSQSIRPVQELPTPTPEPEPWTADRVAKSGIFKKTASISEPTSYPTPSNEIAARKAHGKAELEAAEQRQHDADETYVKNAQAATQRWNESQSR